MNRRRLKRLVSLREHDERQMRAALAEAARELNELARARDLLLQTQAREEAAAAATTVAEADSLRRQHDHLFKLMLLLDANAAQRKEAEAKHAEREEAWLESRRSVKSLETLLERQRVKEKEAAELEQQKLIDMLAVLKHASAKEEHA